ncbi:sensor histidine kinase [Nakamurella aerolata]|uniref:sensor histidine kinase n=1 Tax=Nakamurella aerolata TaxID=1656892 RepID=UPI001BB22D2F|nr:sensor histidine kinase [Nakamurella aerolata]
MNAHLTARTLMWCLHALVVGLLVLVVVRAVQPGSVHPALITVLAAVFAGCYFAGAVLLQRRDVTGRHYGWLVLLCLCWTALLVVTPDALYLAFPLYFLQLHLLPAWPAIGAVVLTAAAAVVSFTAHNGGFTLAAALGPALGAAVAIAVTLGYRTLHRENQRRQRLIDELTATRVELASVEHAAGVAAERERLAREIHDTLAQGFSSIQLLLRAAQRLDATDAAGAGETAVSAASSGSGLSVADIAAKRGEYLELARQSAADNLAEARRLVAALAPPVLSTSTLPDALNRLCDNSTGHDGLAATMRQDGAAAPVPTAYDVALLRVAQSAVGNVLQHAGASRLELTLRYRPDRMELVVSDNGVGFDAGAVTSNPAPADPEHGGFGLRAMTSRLRELGGTLAVQSNPGSGTTLRAWLPLPPVAPTDAPAQAAPTAAPTAPNHSAPNHTAPNHTAPNRAAPNSAAPNSAAPKHAAPEGMSP